MVNVQEADQSDFFCTKKKELINLNYIATKLCCVRFFRLTRGEFNLAGNRLGEVCTSQGKRV